MNFNLANKITFTRILMIPVFLVILLGQFFHGSDYAACAVFIIASATDALDGYIARSRNMITTLGKFLDPLADKLLVCAALVALVELGRLASWIAIVIISRELIITGFRVIASGRGIILAADWSGKIKTVFHMSMIVVLLLNIDNTMFYWLGIILTAGALFFTVYSMFDYILKNKSVLKE